MTNPARCKSVITISYSDASNSGYGGYVVELGPEIAHGQWSPAEARNSSTWRELKAVHSVLLSFAGKLAGHRVKWFTDNQGIMYITQSGSRKEPLQEGALAIHSTCMTHNNLLCIGLILLTNLLRFAVLNAPLRIESSHTHVSLYSISHYQ